MGLLLGGSNPAALKSSKKQYFTATAGQTTFTVTDGYAVGDTDVFMNGIFLLDGEDYNATDGTTIVLTVAANAGDSLSVISNNQFLTSNSYTKAESDNKYLSVTGGTLSSYLRTPNYGISSWSDSATASMEASTGAGEQGVGVKAFGRSVATYGGDILYTSDSRGAGGRHRFGYWNGSSFTNTATLDSSGRWTVPNQPAFHVGKNNGDVGSGNVFLFNNIVLNTGGNYNSSTGRFTAPVAGTYWFFARIINAAGTSFYGNAFSLRKNGSQVVAAHNYTTNAYEENCAAMVIYLGVGEYVDVYNSSGVNMYGVSHEHSNFHGYLIG